MSHSVSNPFHSLMRPMFRTAAATTFALLLAFGSPLARADSYQQLPPPAAAEGSPPQPLTPDQLDTLVAPIALYPDSLLGQILAASTYPLEVVEAGQWLEQYGNLRGPALMEAARQQGWDPSVQVLVAFPDVLAMLTRDVRWTTDLGNAFLTQQADVMNAIQALRFQAKNSGRLATTPEQVVTTDAQNGQYAVRIEPANPQVIYPPVYDPAYVWGPAAYGAYPAVSYYPAGYGGYAGYGSGGYGFGSGINIAGLFSGLLNWGGWGWVLGWFTHSLSLASLFFNLLGFHGFGGGYGGAGFAPGEIHAAGVGALSVWAHDPSHRLGVPYPRGFVAGRNPAAVAAARAGSPRLVASTSNASASRALATAPSRSSFAASGFNSGGYNRAAAPGGWQRFGIGAAFAPSTAPARGIQTGNRATGLDSRAAAPSAYRAGVTRGAPPQQMTSGYRGNAFQNQAVPGRTASSSPRYTAQASPAQHFSEPRISSSRMSGPKFSAPKAPKFSAPKAPKNSGGGHSGKSSHKR